MKQLFMVLFGALTVMGYFLYESILYGALLWFIWNILGVGNLFGGLGVLTYFQAVGILLIVRLIRFDSASIGKNIDN